MRIEHFEFILGINLISEPTDVFQQQLELRHFKWC